jgi:hypothetical protein
LERAADPLEVPALLDEAIRSIVGWEREGARRLSFRLSDRLEDVLAQVTAAYKAHVVPRHYLEWWALARQELHDAIERCAREIETLRALPCATRRQRRKVREQHFYVHLYEFDTSYQATIDNLETFTRWKAAMEQALQDSIVELCRTEQRLRDNLPAI